MTKRMGPGDIPGPPSSNRTIAPVPDQEDPSALDPRVFTTTYDSDDDEMSLDEIREQLARLREPFPEERIEKLPKPMWRDAWKDLKGSNCPVCGGYHVLQHCIHLDYVGHANVTDRLLEIDPFWSWEPMAYTPEGLPLFVKEGLWIKLTICGVTRIGFGDGSSIKEVIGDAIRNAAMRFGVGLDLWAKIDLHSERNRGDGPTSARREVAARGVRGRGEQEGASDGDMAGEDRPARDAGRADQHAADPAPGKAPNQDALDSLGAVCDENGIPRKSIRQSFLNWVAKTGRNQGDILVADPADIEAFTLHLIESMEPPEAGDDGSGAGGAEAAVGAGAERDDADVPGGGDAGDVSGAGDGGGAEAQDIF